MKRQIWATAIKAWPEALAKQTIKLWSLVRLGQENIDELEYKIINTREFICQRSKVNLEFQSSGTPQDLAINYLCRSMGPATG